MYFKDINTREKAEKRIKFIKQTDPWDHFLIEDLFEQDDFELLKNFPPLDSNCNNVVGGFRDQVLGRVFLNDEFVEKNPQFLKLVRLLNDRKLFSDILKEDLSSTTLRVELIDDKYPFFHEVHVDHPDKRITMLIYIDKDDDKNLATDVYVDKDTHYAKLNWTPNGGIIWKVDEVNDKKWHGFTKEKYTGIRRIIILNWVKSPPQWRDETQLYLNERNRHKPFEPEKWDKLPSGDRKGRSRKYDLYMHWCGGMESVITGYREKGDWSSGITHHIAFDNVDILNPADEDNLYKKLKAYILLIRRFRDRGSKVDNRWNGLYAWGVRDLTEEQFKSHMSDFKVLLKENKNEIFDTLGTTKWITSIIMCFYDCGTEEEKFQCLLLLMVFILNRVDFARGRTLFTEDLIAAAYERNFLLDEVNQMDMNNFKLFFENLMEVLFDKEKKSLIYPRRGPDGLVLKREFQLFPNFLRYWLKEENSELRRSVVDILKRQGII